MEFKTKARKWGSSVGIVLPKEVVDEIGIKPDESVTIDIKKKLMVKDVFGILPHRKRSTDEIIKDIKQGWN